MTGLRLVLLPLLWPALLACGRESGQAHHRRAATPDPGFAGVQARGAVAMGVNLYTSNHVFEPLPDGGRIELQRDGADSVGTARIRRHMAEIAARFGTGDFRLPGYVHGRTVPGTAVMTARRAVINYTVESLPRGASVRVRSSDPAAIQAIHEFLAFQRQDHHAGAHHDS